MTLPSVCVMIPTYARTKLLVEAIQSVVQQDYKGEVLAFVLNDCRRQDLQGGGGFSLINAFPRFPSLGAKRHDMLHWSSLYRYDWIAFLDDDDLWMPWYLSAALNSVTDDVQAIFPTHQFKTQGRGKGIRWSLDAVPGGLNMLVRSSMARSVGFNMELNVGEDNEFRQNVKARAGRNIAFVGSPAHVYRMSTPGVHISQSFRGPNLDRNVFLQSAEKHMDNGDEPTGVIEIVPKWEEDYWLTVANIFPDDVPKHPGS